MAINYDLLRRLEERLTRYIDERLATLVKMAPYSRSTADGTLDKVEGYPTAGTDEQTYDFDGRRLQPFGHRSVPPAGVLAAWVGVDGSGVILGEESSRFGPSDLADGETALYNKVTGCLIKLDKNGKVTITDAGGASVTLDGSGNVTVQAVGSVTVKGSGSPGSIQVGAAVKGNVLIQTLAIDSWGVPVTQATPTETQAG